ncbi:MAG: hypothetical protein JST65_00875 [Acidobacteria bacterium]|nr:hypothetical protein [Acidobacteriota bacterium]
MPTSQPVIRAIETARVPPRWGLSRILLSDGSAGYGEFTVEGQLGPAEASLHDMRDAFIGKTVDEAMRLIEGVHDITFYHDGPHFQSARAGIEIALWDLRGKLAGKPIYDLLRCRTRDYVKVYQWAGGNEPSPEKAAEEAAAVVKRGLRAIKLNACLPTSALDFDGRIRAAVEVAQAIRNKVGPGVEIGFDFHGRCKVNSATELARALQVVGPKFYEEAVRPELNRQLGIVRAAAPGVIFATGERMYHPENFLDPGVRDNIGLFQPDLVHIGGISRTWAVAQIAEYDGKAIAPHCPLSPVAFAACHQVAVASKAGCILESSQGIHYNEHLRGAGAIDPWLRFIPEPQRAQFAIIGEGEFTGHMHVLTGPGLGVDLDWDEVRRAEQEEKQKPWKDMQMQLPDGQFCDW